MKYTLRFKLIISFALVILFLFFINLFQMSSVHTLSEIVHDMGRDTVDVTGGIHNVKVKITQIQYLLWLSIHPKSGAALGGIRNEIANARMDAQKELEILGKLTTFQYVSRASDNLSEALEGWAPIIEEVLDATSNGDTTLAETIINQKSNGYVFQRIFPALSTLSRFPNLKITKGEVDSERLVDSIGYVALLAEIFGLLSAATISLFISFSLGRRVNLISDAAEKIAAGDLDLRLPEKGSDEISALAANFNVMTRNLAASRENMRGEIGKRIEAKNRLTRTNRMLRMQSECNQAIILANDERELLQNICDIVVEVGGYRMAWSGKVTDREDKAIIPIAQTGYEEGYLESKIITWADNIYGRGPGGVSVRTKKPAIARDTQTDPDFEPWREEAAKRGYASNISLPLISGDEVFGTLSVYSSYKDAFDEEEVSFLTNLADNLAYGVTALRMRDQWRQVTEELRKEKDFLNIILDNIKDGILVCDAQEVVTLYNKTCRQWHDVPEVPHQALAFFSTLEMLQADGVTPLNMDEAPMHRALNGEEVNDYEMVIRPRGGQSRVVLASGRPIYDSDGKKLGAVVTSYDITERKNAEREIRESHERFITVLDGLDAVVYVIDPDLCGILFANKYARDLLGEEGLQQSICRKIIGHTSGDMCSCCGGTPEDELPGAIAVREIRNDNQDRWSEIRCKSIRWVNGKMVRMVIVMDITERKKIEQAVRESEEKYRMLFNIGYDVVFLHAPKEDKTPGNFIEVNDEACRKLGYTREEFMKLNVVDITPTVTDEQRKWLRANIFANNRVFFETDFIAKNGTLIPVELSGHLFELKGRPTIMTLARDITDRKMAEMKLRQSEEKYHSIVDNASDAIILADATGHLVEVNRKAEEMLGYTRDELLKMIYLDIHTPETRDTTYEMFQTLVETGGMEYTDATLIRKDGGKAPVDITAIMIDMHGKRIAQGMYHDISERKKAEEQAKIHQQQLIQADRLKSLGVLVSGVAHEINNPNGFIMLNAPLLMKMWAGAAPILEKRYNESGDFTLNGLPYSKMRGSAPKLITGIIDGSRRINIIVSKLKDFIRQRPSDKNEVVNVNEAVLESISLVESLINKSTAFFSLRLGKNLPFVKGSRIEFEQVVINLLTNACQALENRDKAVVVKTLYDANTNSVITQVVDEGVGIPRENMDKIMDPFYTTKRDMGGTGLGLSISYGIIRDCGGELEFQSEVGKGTVATISLPASIRGES